MDDLLIGQQPDVVQLLSCAIDYKMPKRKVEQVSHTYFINWLWIYLHSRLRSDHSRSEYLQAYRIKLLF